MLVVILASSLSFGVGGVLVDSDKSIALLSYDSHESISINGNDDLISQKSSNNWTGSGLEGDPIVISNYIIESQLNCISITNVTLYFRIESCELTISDYIGGHGISIVTSENGYIFDCYIHMKYYGIFIFSGGVVFSGMMIRFRYQNRRSKKQILKERRRKLQKRKRG